MPGHLSRRQFMLAAAASGAAAALPAGLVAAARAATKADPATDTFYFFTGTEAATCAAICSAVVPSADPITGAAAPGATEAGAVVFIDRLLSAFSLPKSVADHPAIYLHGPFSNRNAYPDFSTGKPSTKSPPDHFLSPDGQAHFIDIDALQELAWRMLIEGQEAALAQAPEWISKAWIEQVKGGLIPAPPATGLQQIYRTGLAAFDSYSQGLFGTPFASANAAEQFIMLEAAGNVALSELPLPSPLGPSSDAKTLYSYVVTHTFEGTYGLPEYRWRDSNPMWAEIGWDGDTQPLGSSIYDENIHGPGEGPNEGFGEAGVFVPRGGYTEYRPVSYIGPNSGVDLDESDIQPLIDALQRSGVFRNAT